MTLSIMEDHDTFKTALNDYQAAIGDIPKILERYLGYVARTGKPLFSWDMISSLILKKFENVCDSYVSDKPVQCVRISADAGSIEELKLECLKSLNEFSGVPFTIQRICELLMSPHQNYSKLDKFLRGFIRVVKVVTTVDRVGQRITTESQSLANAMSPFQMNETGDSWSAFSNDVDESYGNVNNSSPILDLNCGTEAKCDLDYEDKCLDDSTLTSYPSTTTTTITTTNPVATAIIANNHDKQNMYATDSFFLEQKTISMPPIGALFKPIDQLEAFVQNVSSQVAESSIDSIGDSTKKRAADDSGFGGDECLAPEYGSPAKKIRLGNQERCEETEEAEDEEEEEVVATSSDCSDSMIPSRSCAMTVTTEEACSSTNEDDETEGGCAGDDKEEEEEAEEEQEEDEEMRMSTSGSVATSSSSSCSSSVIVAAMAEESLIKESSAVVRPENGESGMDEPDQSNCDGEDCSDGPGAVVATVVVEDDGEERQDGPGMDEVTL